VVFPRRTSSVRFKASRSFLSSSSAFLPSVLRPILSRLRARQALPRSSPELWSPTAHTSGEGPQSRALPARLVPPPGFGYPLDGLLPSQPVRACFIPTALMGFSPFGVFSSRKVSKAFRPAMDPHTVSRAAAPKGRILGPDRRAAVSGL
jgi:hypothetical protein